MNCAQSTRRRADYVLKVGVYTTVQSMYCYPDTDVLINKLNIHDKAELKQAEEEFTAVKQMALL